MDAPKTAQFAPSRSVGPSERPSRHGHFARKGIPQGGGGRIRVARQYRAAGKDAQAQLSEALEDIARVRTVRVRGI